MRTVEGTLPYRQWQVSKKLGLTRSLLSIFRFRKKSFILVSQCREATENTQKNAYIDLSHKFCKGTQLHCDKVCYFNVSFSYGDFQSIKCIVVRNMIISLQPVIIFLNRILLSSADGLT